MLSALWEELKGVFDEVKYLQSNDLSYLGMMLHFGDDRVSITMGGYVDVFLKDHLDVKSCNSPAMRDVFEIDKDSPLLKEETHKHFHTAVAKLLYYNMRVKIGIATAVSFLCTRVTCATEEDLKKLGRVIGYIKYSRHMGMVLLGSGELVLKGYVDAAFGGHADGKSHTGMVIMLGDACVEFKSSKQKIVTRDSTEAELVGASDRVTNLMYCYEFMCEQMGSFPVPQLMQDNQSAIAMMTLGQGMARTKHLRVRKHALKELVDNKELLVVFTPGGEMKADLLTKPLRGTLFRTHLASVDNNPPLE